jgi:hypothetical protein
MPLAERGVVQPSNIQGPMGNRANNGSVPLTRSASMVEPANAKLKDGDPGGAGAMPRVAGDIPLPNHRFSVDNVGNSQYNDFPVQPGQGAVPVNPFLASGPGLARALPIADEARAK